MDERNRELANVLLDSTLHKAGFMYKLSKLQFTSSDYEEPQNTNKNTKRSFKVMLRALGGRTTECFWPHCPGLLYSGLPLEHSNWACLIVAKKSLSKLFQNTRTSQDILHLVSRGDCYLWRLLSLKIIVANRHEREKYFLESDLMAVSTQNSWQTPVHKKDEVTNAIRYRTH